jgi:8-oxo-dGTP diphosphatase
MTQSAPHKPWLGGKHENCQGDFGKNIMGTGDQASIPRFGTKQDGIDYLERPGVYAVIESNDKQIAIIETRKGYFLPGGGIDTNETDSDALHREILEEMGYQVAIVAKLGETIEYLKAASDENYYRIQSRFYRAHLGSKIGEGIEEDHRLVWLSPREAVKLLVRQGQVWAVERMAKRERNKYDAR